MHLKCPVVENRHRAGVVKRRCIARSGGVAVIDVESISRVDRRAGLYGLHREECDDGSRKDESGFAIV